LQLHVTDLIIKHNNHSRTVNCATAVRAMKANEEIYSKSTTYDFLFMITSNRSRTTQRLRDIFAHTG